jgi:hypothetical protein
MNTSTILELKAATLPSVSVDGWSAVDIQEGLGEVARLRNQLDAWSAVLAKETTRIAGRDAVASISRSMGLSGRAARDLVRLGKVIGQVPAAGPALTAGLATAEHVRALHEVSAATAALLLPMAEKLNVDDFVALVRQARLDELGATNTRARQRASRMLSFFRGPEGCIAMRVVLPTLEGSMVKNRLTEMADAAYRAAHPERAKVTGGHDTEPWCSRLADALVEMAEGGGQRSGRPAVVVVIDPEAVTAEVLGEGPIPFGDAVEIAQAKADVYAMVKTAQGEVLKFGRSRRLATPLQRLALAIAQRGRCSVEGCDASWVRSHAHHKVGWNDGGPTDIDNLDLECPPHHADEHSTEQDTGPPRAA